MIYAGDTKYIGSGIFAGDYFASDDYQAPIGGTFAAVVAALKASISDSVEYCNDNFAQFIYSAIADFNIYKPRTLIGAVQLVAGETTYAAPADFLKFKSSSYGQQLRAQHKIWDAPYPRTLPRVNVIDNTHLVLTPAPTCASIGAMGSQFKFFYYAEHSLTENEADCTIRPTDRPLLLLRAQVEVLKHLAVRNTGKTVSAKNVVSGQPKNGLPGFLAEQFMQEFKRRCACT